MEHDCSYGLASMVGSADTASMIDYDSRFMKDDNIRYVLVRTQTDAAEWLFRESEEASAATWRFDQILESWRGDRRLTSKLRTFLNRCPWHIDAITHYSGCKLNEGKLLDAFAFAQLAVCIARTAFPSEFEEGRHRIPGGFVENRPFLRSLYNLMNAQAWIDEQAAAAATAYQILSYDREDRMGARMELPKYLLQCGLHREAVTLFEDEAFEGNFASAMYLYPVALLGCGREEKAI